MAGRGAPELLVDVSREHLHYARRFHFMFRDGRLDAYGIISMATDDITRD